MLATQYGAPILLDPAYNRCVSLEPLELGNAKESQYNEAWLQNLLHENPRLLPVTDIDPIFGELIPVCRELTTSVGRLDNLFVNELGMLSLVECKLWRNPQARRRVVGQILDYAQNLCRMDYDDLDTAIRRRAGNSLYDIVSENVEELSEKTFIDSVNRNLTKGRFLLMVVGDGIHENVENISAYLQGHAHLNFTFALVEQRLYNLKHESRTSILVQPRIIAKTVEVERAIIRFEGNTTRIREMLNPPDPEPVQASSTRNRGTITEQVFFESIESEYPGLSEPVKMILNAAEKRGLILDAGASAIMVKCPSTQFNFMAFQRGGNIRNYGCGSSEVGRSYLEKLAEIFDDAVVHEASNGFHSTVRKLDTYLSVKDILRKQDEWFALVDEIRTEIALGSI